MSGEARVGMRKEVKLGRFVFELRVEERLGRTCGTLSVESLGSFVKPKASATAAESSSFVRGLYGERQGDLLRLALKLQRQRQRVLLLSWILHLRIP